MKEDLKKDIIKTLFTLILGVILFIGIVCFEKLFPSFSWFIRLFICLMFVSYVFQKSELHNDEDLVAENEIMREENYKKYIQIKKLERQIEELKSKETNEDVC